MAYSKRKPPVGETAPHDMGSSSSQHLSHQWEQYKIDQAADLLDTLLPLLLGRKAVFRVGIVVRVRVHVGGPVQGMRHVVEEGKGARCLDAKGCEVATWHAATWNKDADAAAAAAVMHQVHWSRRRSV